ncbi:MAG: hypothetical protein QM731_16340 [Chitinophagaceae bacterium]
MLQQTFTELLHRYTDDQNIVRSSWQEIETAYTAKGRHYHTLLHLENLFTQLNQVKNSIADTDAVLFALFYHDIVYNVSKQNNEEKSALLAEETLTKIGVQEQVIQYCKEHILATKQHSISSNADTNLFTDADLSILGQETETYNTYVKQIRKEYTIYPDFLYKPGRKKVLQHFLSMPAIYKTNHFKALYEQQAKANMEQELQLLQA